MEYQNAAYTKAIHSDARCGLRRKAHIPVKKERLFRRPWLPVLPVDQIATVYINGCDAGSHAGGYTAFTLDITQYIRQENVITVKVRDFSDTSYHSRGKQKTKRGGIWYTTSV